MARLLPGVAAISVIALGLLGCSASAITTSASGPGVAGPTGSLLVVTTVSPITSIAASIGGDRIRIEGIVPEGTNSHTFEPAPQVAALLSAADLILVNGLMLEEPTLRLAEANKKAATQILQIGTEIIPESDLLYDFTFPKEEGRPNPHLWTDTTYAIKYGAAIRDAFAALDPANANYYQGNFTLFEKQVNALDKAVRTDQQTVPAGDLKLLTYHDAYAYFAKDFGWEIIGAVQPKNFSDPSAADVAALIDQVNHLGVKTIFGSEVFPSPVLAEIGQATGARYEDSLRDDDLPGDPGEAGHSWLGLMKYNYTTMIKGLGGHTPTIDAVTMNSSVPDTAVYPQ